jgi:hypothetical protein
MRKRIKIGNILILIGVLIILILSSCSGNKAYTQRNCGVKGKSGSHVVAKTQSYNNFESAMKRTDPKHIYVLGIKLPRL